MKSVFYAIALAFSLTGLLSADVPVLKAADAAAIAQADLASRGLESTIFIAEIVYKKESILNGPVHWEILWSSAFDAQTEGRKEIGIRVTMDGTYKRFVK